MPGTLNRVMIIGSVGRDAEGRYTPSGTPVTTFSVATNRRSKEGGEETEWFTVVAWEKLAETCNQYVKKGLRVFVEGRLQTRKWEANGEKKSKVEVVANQVIFLSPKASNDAEEEAAPFEDLPF